VAHLRHSRRARAFHFHRGLYRSRRILKFRTPEVISPRDDASKYPRMDGRFVFRTEERGLASLGGCHSRPTR
jgi:hypothetical protein